jgi:NADH-quinone oxidoreductase subunit H
LAHVLEWVALTGFVATILVPLRSSLGMVDGLLFALISLALVPLLTLLAAATARLKLSQATRLVWRWAGTAAAIALILSMAMPQGGR